MMNNNMMALLAALLLAGPFVAVNAQECVLPPPRVTLWRRPEENPIDPNYGPGVIDGLGGTDPTTLTSTTSIETEPAYVCDDGVTTLEATSTSASSPPDFIKIINLGPDGSHVEVEVLNGFASTGEVPFVAIEKPALYGSPSCGQVTEGVGGLGFRSGDQVTVETALCTPGADPVDPSKTISTATITLYGGMPGTDPTRGCVTGPDTVVHTFIVPCECPGAETAAAAAPAYKPPVAIDDYAATVSGMPVPIDILTNDKEPDGDPLTVSATLAPGPKHGVAVLESDQTFTYTPEASFVGEDSFVYTLSDGKGEKDTVTVVIVVSDPIAIGDGMVTGGGWILLNEHSYMKDVPSSDLIGIKANFGFNAKFKKDTTQLPDGSTNFDIEGNGFHFHTARGATPSYDMLEVVCSDAMYGPEGNTVYARWTGVGRVARTMGKPKNNDWVDGHRFYVSVQDNGEPSTEDMWRIRILDLDGSLMFDSNKHSGEGGPIYFEDKLFCPSPADCDPLNGWEPDFVGNYLGGSNTETGGGNIQTHCPKTTSMDPDTGLPNPADTTTDTTTGTGTTADTTPTTPTAPTPIPPTSPGKSMNMKKRRLR